MQRLLDLVVLTECPGVASCQWAGAHRIQCLPRGWDEDLGVVCMGWGAAWIPGECAD